MAARKWLAAGLWYLFRSSKNRSIALRTRSRIRLWSMLSTFGRPANFAPLISASKRSFSAVYAALSVKSLSRCASSIAPSSSFRRA